MCDVKTFVQFIGQLNCLNKQSCRSCEARSLQYVYLLIGASGVEAAFDQMRHVGSDRQTDICYGLYYQSFETSVRIV